MDIKEKIEQAAKKLMDNPALLKKFETNPASVIEQLIGVDLPDEVVNQIVEGIKAKIAATKVGSALSGLGKLFN